MSNRKIFLIILDRTTKLVYKDKKIRLENYNPFLKIQETLNKMKIQSESVRINDYDDNISNTKKFLTQSYFPLI